MCLCVPLVSIIIAAIPQNATWDFAQNAGAGFVHFAGGRAIAYNRQAVKSRLYFLHTTPGYNSGTKNYKKLQMGFSDKPSHQIFFLVRITINIFFS